MNCYLFLILLLSNALCAQTPSIKWQRCVGGSSDDEAKQVFAVDAGKILLGGSTSSNDGDVILTSGLANALLVSIDSLGNILASKCYGGQDITEMSSFCRIPGINKLLIGGGTNSADFSAYHGGFPPLYDDAFLLSIDSSGNKEWAKCYGEYYEDFAFQVKACNNGGFILSAQVQGNGGDVHGYHGFEDWWIVRTDSIGDILWSRCLG